jgi:DNA-binding NarL/FixJ family response regulator
VVVAEAGDGAEALERSARGDDLAILDPSSTPVPSPPSSATTSNATTTTTESPTASSPPREEEIVKLIADGHSSKKIGHTLAAARRPSTATERTSCKSSACVTGST